MCRRVVDVLDRNPGQAELVPHAVAGKRSEGWCLAAVGALDRIPLQSRVGEGRGDGLDPEVDVGPVSVLTEAGRPDADDHDVPHLSAPWP